MYSSQPTTSLSAITDLPQSSTGAPLPTVLSNEHNLFLLYLAEQTHPAGDITSVRPVGSESVGESIVILKFKRYESFGFGAPNDEAISGHPLYQKGLQPNSAFEVMNSPWIGSLEEMNRVHQHHSRERFARLRHFIITFHDSTFECVAESYSVEIMIGSLSTAIQNTQHALGQAG
jgi:hypothetical protein